MRTYVVAGSRPWNKRTFQTSLSVLPGRWVFVATPSELASLDWPGLQPAFCFFLHWSWKVPTEVLNSCECVNFHMTNLPFGRGGSPLQNLIVRGHHSTLLTALRMEERLDAGPIYLQEELSLAGGAEEIYIRASDLAAKMIHRIIEELPEPVAQQGEPVTFKRRSPAESEIPAQATLAQAADHIRMLDAEGYPRAFVRCGGLKFEFSRAAIYDGRVEADVTITQEPG